RFGLYVLRGQSRKTRPARRGTTLPADVRRFLLPFRFHRAVGFVPAVGGGLRTISPRGVGNSGATRRQRDTKTRNRRLGSNSSRSRALFAGRPGQSGRAT